MSLKNPPEFLGPAKVIDYYYHDSYYCGIDIDLSWEQLEASPELWKGVMDAAKRLSIRHPYMSNGVKQGAVIALSAKHETTDDLATFYMCAETFTGNSYEEYRKYQDAENEKWEKENRPRIEQELRENGIIKLKTPEPRIIELLPEEPWADID